MQEKSTTLAQDPKKNIWKPFITLMRQVKVPWVWLAAAILVSLFGAQLSLLIPDATAKVIAGDISMGAILFMVACMFLSALETAVHQVLGRIVSQKAQMYFHKYLLKKTFSLPVPYYDKHMANELITRITNDNVLISEFWGWSVPYLPSAIYRFVGTFVILFSYNWRLAALMGIMVPIIFVITIVTGKVQFTWNNRIQSKTAGLGSYLAEALQNIPLIKVFAKEDREEQKGKDAINEIYNTKKKYTIVSSVVGFFSSAESIILTLVTVVGGAMIVRGGYITIEDWIAFYMYASGLVGSFSSILRYYESIKAAQGSARRISEIAAELSEDRGGPNTVSENPGDIRFENVTFAYDQNKVLDGASFTIPQGKTTAIVGRSGAGKSTIFGLLERFYVPQDGKIVLDGKDAKEYSVTSWRKSIGYVPQNSPLFSGTIRFNMTYGLDRTPTEAELIQAAKDANIYDYIQSQPDGFDTDVGERGTKLSGGQKQRVAIARAILKNPKILLLDEATSNLDAEAAYEVQQAMEKLKKGRTVVVVAHEMRNVENADQILVLDGGKITDQGTHEELMKMSTLYKSLRELQTVPVSA